MATLTGAGGTLQVGDRLLTVKHLNAYDLGKLEAFVKERRPRPMAKFVTRMRELAPLKEFDPEGYQKVFDFELQKAHAEVEQEETKGVSEKDILSAIDGFDCVAYTIWLMASPNHPELTFEWVREHIKTEDLTQLNNKIMLVNKSWMDVVEQTQGAGTVPFVPKDRLTLPG
jgi:hypothetical protein